MKIKIIQNEALIAYCNIDNVDNIDNKPMLLILKTIYQEYFKTGKPKGKKKELSKEFLFSNRQELQKAIDIITKLEKPYKLYTSYITYRSSQDKNYNWDTAIDGGLYYNFFNNYEIIN